MLVISVPLWRAAGQRDCFQLLAPHAAKQFFVLKKREIIYLEGSASWQQIIEEDILLYKMYKKTKTMKNRGFYTVHVL